MEYTLVKKGIFTVIYSPAIIDCGYLIPVDLGEGLIKGALGITTSNPITNFYMTQIGQEDGTPRLPDETWDFALSAGDGGPTAYEKFLFAALGVRRKLGEPMTFGDHEERVMRDQALPLYMGISVNWDQTELLICQYSNSSKTELTQQSLDNPPSNLSSDLKDSWNKESFGQIFQDSNFLKLVGGLLGLTVLVLIFANIFAPKVYVPVQSNPAGQSQNR